MESQPQNPEFMINPENFHLCKWIKLLRPQCLYDDVTNYVFQPFGARSLCTASGISLSFGVVGRHCQEPGQIHCFIV